MNQIFDEMACSVNQYVMPEEKLYVALHDLMSADSKRRWQLLQLQRRRDGLPPPQGRQLAFWIFAHWFHSTGSATEIALQSLLALRDSCKREPVSAETLSNFLTLFDKALLAEGASKASERERLIFLQDMLQPSSDPDVRDQLKFNYEN